MATTIVTKYGSDAPAASDLVRGELAVDTENGRLYTENSSGAVVEIGLNPEGNVDITGTATMDGLTVEGSDNSIVSRFKATNGIFRILPFETGLGVKVTALNGDESAFETLALQAEDFHFVTSTTERMRIDASGTVKISHADTASEGLRVIQTTAARTSGGALGLFYDDQAGTTQPTLKVIQNGTGDILQLFDGGSQAVTVKDGGNVGIGTDSPSKKLHVYNTASADVALLESTQTFSTLAFKSSTNSSTVTVGIDVAGNAAFENKLSSGSMTFVTNSSERMRITSNGNVGIGRTPTEMLDIQSDSGDARIRLEAPSGSDTEIKFFNDGAAQYTIGHDDATDNFVIGGANVDGPLVSVTKSGNLLVGKTSTGDYVTGIEMQPAGAILAYRTTNVASIFGRTNDGEITRFTANGSKIGQIGSGTGIHFAGAACGLRMHSGGTKIFPTNGSGSALNDTVSLGAEGARWTEVYATNGTINTSDRNEKQDIATLSDAEQRVAVACKGLLRKFRWIDAVEAKGDDARIHFGIIAQDLQAAFEAEGLDAGRYGMFINTTWTDEETEEEHTSLGVRYSELLAFIIAAI